MMNGIATLFRRIVLCGILSAVMSACAATVAPELPKQVTGGTRFTLSAPQAKTVCVVGSFNGWIKGTMPMKRAGDRGLWVTEVALGPGEYTFMYVVDDKEWVAPPLAEDFVMDGFGQTNGVVIVR
jgi:1,4-alpha-glucan branching enzyme